jgi:ribosome-associated protein
MERDLTIQEGIEIPAAELETTASRAGGPGGQHVNKTSSRITLRWNLARSRALPPWLRARAMRRLRGRMTRDGALIVHVDDDRSQHRNRELARERLAELVREAIRPRKRRIETAVPREARERRLEQKRRRGARKRERRRPDEQD